MKILIDSNDLPPATRLDTWRGMLCDTFIGMDCYFPSARFRSVVRGHAVGDHLLVRVQSSRHAVDRSRTLIKRDGMDMVYFGVLLAGDASTVQGGRETVFERGAVLISDTSRPFRTCVGETADIITLGVPKQQIAERVRGIEDLAAFALRPAKPVETIFTGLLAGFDEALRSYLPPHDVERLTTETLDVLAMTILSAGLPPKRPSRARATLIQ